MPYRTGRVVKVVRECDCPRAAAQGSCVRRVQVEWVDGRRSYVDTYDDVKVEDRVQTDPSGMYVELL